MIETPNFDAASLSFYNSTSKDKILTLDGQELEQGFRTIYEDPYLISFSSKHYLNRKNFQYCSQKLLGEKEKFKEKNVVIDKLIELNKDQMTALGAKFKEYLFYKYNFSPKIRKSGSLRNVIKIHIPKIKKNKLEPMCNLENCFNLIRNEQQKVIFGKKDRSPLIQRNLMPLDFLTNKKELSKKPIVISLRNEENIKNKINENFRNLPKYKSKRINSYHENSKIENPVFPAINHNRKFIVSLMKQRHFSNVENIYKNVYHDLNDSLRDEFEQYSKNNYGILNRKKIENMIKNDRNLKMNKIMKITSRNEIKIKYDKKRLALLKKYFYLVEVIIKLTSYIKQKFPILNY